MFEKVVIPDARFSDVFRDWVHHTAQSDAVTKARHASLIASHMLGGLISAFVFAGYFLWTGAPAFATLVAAICFLSPVGIALFLSQTGRLDIAHLLSSLQLASLVTLASALTGGTQSFALLWLAIVPLEAALSTDRRMMLVATGLAVIALAGLHVATVAGVLPSPVALPIGSRELAFAICLGAVGYAGALAANVQEIHRGAARELERSRERYRLLAENANDVIARHENPGLVTFASLASHAVLGIAPEKLTVSGFEAVLADTDRARYRAAVGRCLKAGAPVVEEFRIARQRDGAAVETIWIEMRGQRAEDVPGQPYVVTVTRDITRAKAEALELARAREDAERASRAKSAFLATMSHELRTPLSSIIGFAEILHRELLIKEREPKLADYSRIIHQSGEHLLGLVKDLLDVSRIESGHLTVDPEPFALAEVALAVTETLKPQAATKSIRIVNTVSRDLPDMMADRRATKQILINLVTNAVKFTPSEGTITLGAEMRGDAIEFWVTDTGIGIPHEHIQRIVQPFYQVDTGYDRHNDGVGLGLSIVRGLIELQAGTLRIESRQGHGSRFIVTLPADTGAEAQIEAEATEPRSPRVIDMAEVFAQRHVLSAAIKPTGVGDPTPQSPRLAASA